MRGTSHWYVNLDLHLYGGINPVWFQDRFAPFGDFLFFYFSCFSYFSYIVNFLVNPRAYLHPGIPGMRGQHRSEHCEPKSSSLECWAQASRLLPESKSVHLLSLCCRFPFPRTDDRLRHSPSNPISFFLSI